MKANRITYWTTTSIVSLMMVYSGFLYLTATEMQQAFQHLGYPQFFRVELAIAKIIGAVLLLAPVGARVKEWVYAGFSIVFVSAFISHLAAGDPLKVAIMPMIFFALLLISYFTLHRYQRKEPQPKQSLMFSKA